MVRALIELAITILIAVVARAVLASVLKGIANASATAFQQQHQEGHSQANPSSRSSSTATAPKAGELHKDPVCGTYVTESTRFRGQIAGRSFYYCSEDCREKHALVAR